ncbi:uncharacterized protein LOC103698726 [Phoenix dactylifera]|uniref:Uncharacterized protein LOC103698726 n=1 Tax=Phoenix dactylifera TaxID=42345 RepID=A0A8B8ZHW8_PHODC|nr:uncharacterized protein LOC103698726 [Phoenix dactylifera]XP_038972883.1 uncharacterized protein LOC103698726 [Phoenix dactylifera]XP_038972884.1 uncharacterized protein LOC103698726 [Phoenix dactylifera]XP_038972885.1 uncharacterized protein LOC103698726 [Phoenix dactylifera]
MGWYDDIVKWNDSAGEEAFRNAKARYWAEINGLHCNLPLPDPDMHIDMVSDDAYIDPQLVEDLEDVYKQPSGASSPGGSSSVADKPILATGWFQSKDPGLHECRIPSVVGDSDDLFPMNDTKPEPHTVNAECGDASKLVSRDEGSGENGNSLNMPIPTVADELVPMIGWIDIKDIVPEGWGDDTEAEPVNGDNNTNSGNAANFIEWIDIKDIVPDGWGDDTEAEPVNGDNNGNAANSISWDKVSDNYVGSKNSGWGSRAVQDSCNVSNQSSVWDGGVLRDGSWVNQGGCSWGHWENKTNGRKRNRNRFGSRYANLRFQGEDRRT